MKKKIFLGGINCLHCAEYVSEALRNIGAKDVEVSFIKSLATFEIDQGTSDDAIKLAVEDAGYEILATEWALEWNITKSVEF